MTGTSQNKLAKRSYSPFQVIERIGPVAYKLCLPEGSRIHPVFHCSLLKPFLHDTSATPKPLSLPPSTLDNQPVIMPLAILSTQWEGSADNSRLQVLVQWQGLHVDDTSWEDWTTLKEAYHLEDKVIFYEAGNDRPSTTQTKNERPKRQTSGEAQPMKWVMGLRVAFYLTEALEYCTSKKVYNSTCQNLCR